MIHHHHFRLFMFLVTTLGMEIRLDAQEPTAWEPARTWVFAVGLVEWKDPKWSSFPKENRQDEILVETFKQRGVPASQIVFLKDEQATSERVRQEYEELIQKPKTGDFFFLYYSGHGFNSDNHRQTYLATYDASDENRGLRVGSFLVAAEKYFKGKSMFIAADHCCSGGIAESVKVLKPCRGSYSVFCSAHVNSSSTGAWTFTEGVINALRGESFIDDNADGNVTLGEMAANIEEDMAFADDQMAQFAKRGSVKSEMILSRSKSIPVPKVGDRYEVLDEGQWYRGYVKDLKDDRYLIHYYGYPDSEEEWVTSDRMRKLSRKMYPKGARVNVLSSQKWYSGKVLTTKLGLHHIKFDDWEAEWNEWVPAAKIQPIRPTKD